LAATLSRSSRHPLSRALAGLHPETLPVSDWREERAAGVGGMVQTPEGLIWVQMGSAEWLIADGMAAPADWAQLTQGMPKDVSLTGLTVEGRLVGLFTLADPMRPDTAWLLARLARKLEQIRPAGRTGAATLQVLSGDRQSAVDAVVARLRVEQPALNDLLQARGQLLPENKAASLLALQRSGHRVAFVGDGLNDAPALAQADLGLAVAGAADVAREAADIILLRPDLAAVMDALEIAQATRRTIHQNLTWAFVYNIAVIPLAVVGLLHPVVCALTMGLSDLLVVGNALRLKRWRGSAE
jgi:Cu+-exporting ATPase